MPDDRKPRVVLLGASFQTGNLGVGALAASAVRCFLGSMNNPEVSLLDYGKSESSHTIRVGRRNITVPLVNMRFSKKFFQSNNIAMLLLIAVAARLIPSMRLRRAVLSRNRCIRTILEASVVGSIAGGDSFSDIYGLRRLLYVSLPQILALLLDRPLLLLPQTMGPFNHGIAKTIARYILRRASHIYCRDHEGPSAVAALLGTGVPPHCTVCYDMAFALEPTAPERLEITGFTSIEGASRPVIGLNISGLLFIGGYARNNMFGLQVDYRNFVHRLIDYLIIEKNASVVLIPHVFGSLPGSESDVAACEDVYRTMGGKHIGRLAMLCGSYNESEIKYAIGRCDFLIASRMHACIAALSQCVPAMALAYSDKFTGVMKTITNEPLVLDARTMGPEQILEALDEAIANRARTRRMLASVMPEIKETLLNAFGTVHGSSRPTVSLAVSDELA